MTFDLNKSKTMWGFGIAILIYIVRKILLANGIILLDGEWDVAILFINGVAALYGIYGVRDAIRSIDKRTHYQGLPLPGVTDKSHQYYPDNLGKIEEDFKDAQLQGYIQQR